VADELPRRAEYMMPVEPYWVRASNSCGRGKPPMLGRLIYWTACVVAIAVLAAAVPLAYFATGYERWVALSYFGLYPAALIWSIGFGIRCVLDAVGVSRVRGGDSKPRRARSDSGTRI